MWDFGKLKIKHPFNPLQPSSLDGASGSSTVTFSWWRIVEILYPQPGYCCLLLLFHRDPVWSLASGSSFQLSISRYRAVDWLLAIFSTYLGFLVAGGILFCHGPASNVSLLWNNFLLRMVQSSKHTFVVSRFKVVLSYPFVPFPRTETHYHGNRKSAITIIIAMTFPGLLQCVKHSTHVITPNSPHITKKKLLLFPNYE